MHLRWSTYEELKEIICAIGIKKLSVGEPEWGGLGVVITSNTNNSRIAGHKFFGGRLNYYSIDEHDDKIVVTPHAAELSWLVKETLGGPNIGDKSPAFCIFELIEFFISSHRKNEKFSSQTMIYFILDRMIDLMHGLEMVNRTRKDNV